MVRMPMRLAVRDDAAGDLATIGDEEFLSPG